MKKNWFRLVSLVSQSARYHLGVAIALVAIIPLLCLALIVAINAFQPDDPYTLWSQVAISGLALLVGLSGYSMLRKYPKNLEQLRVYLEEMASGELPPRVTLLDNQTDITAIEEYLNTILTDMRRKVERLEKEIERSQALSRTVQSQAREILEAERHRVMIESLGAACHHIGQPATVLVTYLDMLRSKVTSEEDSQHLDECRRAADSIADILQKLRGLSEYRTVPYQTFHEAFSSSSDEFILDIEPKHS